MQVTITDGLDKSWKFSQEYLLKYSRFYQDLCKETSSSPLELILPNILAGFDPNFKDLENMVGYALMNQATTFNAESLMTILDTTSKMKALTNLRLNNLMTLAKRLDMVNIVAEIFLMELNKSITQLLIMKQLEDIYIFNCVFEYQEPLQTIHKILSTSNPNFLIFVLNHKDKILSLQKKYTGNKKLIMVEIYHEGSYSIDILIKGGLLPF